MQLLATPTPTRAYADKINQQFYKDVSQYVGLPQRLKQTINGNEYYQSLIDDTMQEFIRRNPKITKWSDMTFCSAIKTTLDKIVIDITLQRMLVLTHGAKILDHFAQIRVMPICVYEDPMAPGQYVCWDGQHTAIVLYLIAVALKEDISKCEIPIVIYNSSQKSEMRQNFMALNGDAKQPLDQIDKFHQMIFGVRTDGTKIPAWELAEKKQKLLEGAKMFATHDKFSDTDEPGALTRLDELMNPRYDLIITEHFCKYFVSICRSNRPVQPKECWLMYEFFRQCQIEKITLDRAYISGVANSLKIAFGGDFDPIAMMSQAKVAYRDYYERVNGYAHGIRYPEVPLGLTFLIKQISKNFNGTMPKGPQHWPVQSNFLF
jgi:hypothetical protein